MSIETVGEPHAGAVGEPADKPGDPAVHEPAGGRVGEQASAPVLAGRGRRLTATLIDMALVPLLTLVLVMLFDVVEDAEDYQSAAWLGGVLGLAVVSYLILNGYLLGRRGQTIGKALLGIRIVSPTDLRTPPLWKLVGIRALFFPLLYLIVAWPLTPLPLIDQAFIFGRRRRCLHDLAAGTIVVRREPGGSTEP